MSCVNLNRRPQFSCQAAIHCSLCQFVSTISSLFFEVVKHILVSTFFLFLGKPKKGVAAVFSTPPQRSFLLMWFSSPSRRLHPRSTSSESPTRVRDVRDLRDFGETPKQSPKPVSGRKAGFWVRFFNPYIFSNWLDLFLKYHTAVNPAMTVNLV